MGMVQEVTHVLKFKYAVIGKGLVKTLECVSSSGTAYSPGSPLKRGHAASTGAQHPQPGANCAFTWGWGLARGYPKPGLTCTLVSPCNPAQSIAGRPYFTWSKQCRNPSGIYC